MHSPASYQKNHHHAPRAEQHHASGQNVFFTPGFEKLVTIPHEAVYHVPRRCAAKHLVLCARFDPKDPKRSCPLRSSCSYVHADASRGTVKTDIHVNYAWTSLAAVTYERCDAGLQLRVAPPSSRDIIDVMDSSAALKTRALIGNRAVLQHCAHYYFDRYCQLGCNCSFVHAVFVDPDAQPFQRAPVPRQLGNGRELLLTKRQRAERVPSSSALQRSSPEPLVTQLLDNAFSESCTASTVAATSIRSNASSHGDDLYPCADQLSDRSDSLSQDTSNTATPTPLHKSTVFRHNPYDVVTGRVLVR